MDKANHFLLPFDFDVMAILFLIDSGDDRTNPADFA